MATRRKTNVNAKDRHCTFCVNQIDVIDFRDTETLRRLISSYGKIVPRRRSGVCSAHQRKVARAIKRSRIMGLLPFTIR